MTSEGLGDMFEGDSADTEAGRISAHVDRGPSDGSSVHRPGSVTKKRTITKKMYQKCWFKKLLNVWRVVQLRNIEKVNETIYIADTLCMLSQT
jgi:hypothetical protein